MPLADLLEAESSATSIDGNCGVTDEIRAADTFNSRALLSARHPGRFAAVDVILSDPLRQGGWMDAEIVGGAASGVYLLGPARCACTELGQMWPWHDDRSFAQAATLSPNLEPKR